MAVNEIEWRECLMFPSYLVSNTGEVFSNKTFQILKPRKKHDGYLYVELDGITYALHRLVAEVWCQRDDPDQKQVDHIDRNRENNTAENLRWVTVSENQKNRRSWKK